MVCAIAMIFAASYLRTRASIWIKLYFTVAMALLLGALSYFGMTLRYNNWTLFGVVILFLLIPERERRPWWPAVKRTVARIHEDPQDDEERVAELFRRPNA
jgi:quinol-cytochrome oxidoreductase complex cytochrome b subunit